MMLRSPLSLFLENSPCYKYLNRRLVAAIQFCEVFSLKLSSLYRINVLSKYISENCNSLKMSLLPYLLDSYIRPTRVMDQQFGLCLDPEDLLSPVVDPRQFGLCLRNPVGYIRPWRSALSQKDTGSTIAVNKDKFEANLDVQQFKPEEITVKVSGNNTVTIEGKHEEKQDEHGFISRQFVRRYVLPQDCDAGKIESKLSSDGVLTITAPKIKTSEAEHKTITIQHTGQPAKIENKKEEKKEEKEEKKTGK
ncbi:hypothetical protein HHI36_006760 [Cryptolaemus montrouzieri]|uniref:SHSP domain-containing protein n=1 Tax=Cryptolaemus montrouzieri TaxID=559131 RepID=A0ABD2NY28_9CUCU